MFPRNIPPPAASMAKITTCFLSPAPAMACMELTTAVFFPARWTHTEQGRITAKGINLMYIRETCRRRLKNTLQRMIYQTQRLS